MALIVLSLLLFIDKPAGVDLSDKPILEDLKRCETPKIVTESDLKETKDDFQNLMFNHETEVGVFTDLRGIQIFIFCTPHKVFWIFYPVSTKFISNTCLRYLLHLISLYSGTSWSFL